jgi:hypothetical protein
MFAAYGEPVAVKCRLLVLYMRFGRILFGTWMNVRESDGEASGDMPWRVGSGLPFMY